MRTEQVEIRETLKEGNVTILKGIGMILERLRKRHLENHLGFVVNFISPFECHWFVIEVME